MRHLRLQQGVRLRQPEDVPAAVLGRGHAVSDPGVHGGTALLRLRVQDLEEGDAALAAASGSDLLSVAGDVPEDLLHGGEALPGAADRRERGCGEHPAEVFVFQPQVPDREDPGRGGRRHGGSDKGIRRGDAEQRKREDEGGGHRPVQQGAEEGDHPSQGERHPSGERRGGADRRPAFSEQPQAEIAEGAGAGETLHGRSCFTAAAFSEQPAHPGIGFAGVHGGQGEPVLHAGEADQGRREVSDLQAEDDEGREREGDRTCEEGGRKDHEGREGAEEVPDRRASAAFERFEGGDEPDRTKTGERVLLPAVRQDDAGVPVPSEREGRAERVCPGMGEVQYEAEGEADDGSDVHPGLFVSVGHQADAGNGQGGVRS